MIRVVARDETRLHSARMALAKKGSRLIEVDGETYRWKVSADDEPGFGIVVELADGPAQQLILFVEHGNVVSPKIVRYAISEGLRQGWAPAKSGSAMRLRTEVQPNEKLLPCPCCDYRTLTKRADYDICAVCFWEDDGHDTDGLDRYSGPNPITLRAARENFKKFGACDEKSREHVLPPERRAQFERVCRQLSS